LTFGGANANGLEFDPSGRWLATTQATVEGEAAFWAFQGPFPHVLLGHERNVIKLVFTPDGNQLVSASNDGTARSWALSAGAAEERRILLRTELFFPALAVDAESRDVFVSTGRGHLVVVPLSGEPPRELSHVEGSSGLAPIALDEGGRVAVMAASPVARDPGTIRVRDLETGEEKPLPPPPAVDGRDKWFYTVHFRDRDHLVSCGGAGLLVHGIKDSSVEVLAAQPRGGCAIARDGRMGFGVTEVDGVGRIGLLRFSLDNGRPPEPVASHGRTVEVVALDSSDTLIATGSADGTVRIGPVSGEEPHLFLGHQGAVLTVAFSPDGRFLASAGADRSIRIWAVPDVRKTPPHLRGRDELLRILRSRTNLRAVPDPLSATGWRLELGPFPGWAKLPEW
jgi:WD40 repeat protein